MPLPPHSAFQARAERAGVTFPGGHAALAEVNLTVPGGEFVAIVGPSGCGKSTLLRLFAGLIAPTSGHVTVGDQPATQALSGRRIGFVFQEARLLPWRTAVQNVRLPLELEGSPRKTRAPHVSDVLDLVGLTRADASKTPRMLSGGMRMRVSLARALVTEPELLLLDEPFGALDDILRQQLNDELIRIWLRRRPTAIFVTHNVAEAVYLAQRVLVVTPSPGRIAAEISVPFDYPRFPELRATAQFAKLTGEVSARLREESR